MQEQSKFSPTGFSIRAMIVSMATLHHVLTMSPNIKSSQIPGASKKKSSDITKLQEILSKGKLMS